MRSITYINKISSGSSVIDKGPKTKKVRRAEPLKKEIESLRSRCRDGGTQYIYKFSLTFTSLSKETNESIPFITKSHLYQNSLQDAPEANHEIGFSV